MTKPAAPQTLRTPRNDPGLRRLQRLWDLLRQRPGVYYSLSTLALRLGENRGALELALEELCRGELARRRGQGTGAEFAVGPAVALPDDTFESY